MDHAKKGADALAASDAKAAVEHYTKALIEHSTSPDYFVQRSIAFTRLKPPRHDLALQDAEFATLCGQKRGKRDKIMDAQQRRVVSLYNSERYADAKFVLDTMQKWRPENNKKSQMEHAMWKAKIDTKLKTASQNPTVTEYPSTPLPDEKDLKKLLQKQLKPDGSFNYNGEDVPEAAQDVLPTADAATNAATTGIPTNNAATTATTPASAPTAQPPQKIRHEWYQNNASVILTIYAKGVSKDSTEIDIEDDSISISFPHPSDTSSTFNLSFDPLHALIDPFQSKHRILSTKVEITLAKAVPGQKWPALEGLTPLKATTDSASTAPTSSIPASALNPAPTTGPSYPTSSKSGPKNWDKLATELTAKKPKKPKKKADDKDKDADSASDVEEDGGYESDVGGDEVDGFFKKLYAGSDPDTRRAMMKSFTESNGTALSTNWAEVGSKRVDVVKGKDEED